MLSGLYLMAVICVMMGMSAEHDSVPPTGKAMCGLPPGYSTGSCSARGQEAAAASYTCQHYRQAGRQALAAQHAHMCRQCST